MHIREYKAEDFKTLQNWWEASGIYGTTSDFISDTSYIVESNQEPILFISLILTNLKEYAYVENFTAMPNGDAMLRREAINMLIPHIESIAKGLGYKKLITLAPNEKLKERFKLQGYNPTISGAYVMLKELI